MFKELIMQASSQETLVAILEDHRLAELFLEKSIHNRMVGNIYRGKVANVLPGMQAAFVDIGIGKNAFLYVEDIISNTIIQDENSKKDLEIPNIKDLLKEGQSLTVQVVKEPHGTKGARVTTSITLPGRLMVLMPTVDYIGVSRRIENEKERTRLKEIAQNIRTNKMGIIVRTAALNVSEKELQEDFDILSKEWDIIQDKIKKASPPAVIHEDLELIDRVLRDLLTDDLERITINSEEAYEKTLEFTSLFAPHLKNKILLKEKENIIFDYGITEQIEQALKRKVWLDCGGYLIIDQTEALTIIDVNTGKYVGKTTLEDTVVKTNLQAAKEIARQLRLRSIGGIVIIDFIDMYEPFHRSLVLDKLEEEFKKDKTKTHILGITQLGLVELTRKKVRRTLNSLFQKDCPTCQGKGRILNEEALSRKIKKAIYENLERTANELVFVEAQVEVIEFFVQNFTGLLASLEKEYKKNIIFRGRVDLMPEQYRILTLGSTGELESYFWPLKIGETISLPIDKAAPDNPKHGSSFLGQYSILVRDGGAFVGQTVMVKIVDISDYQIKAKIYPV